MKRRKRRNFATNFKLGNESEQEQIPNNNDDDDDMDDYKEVPVIGNNIYLYSGIDFGTALKINTNLAKLNKRFLFAKAEFELMPEDIKLYINSPGGIFFAGMSIVDNIRNSKTPITSIVDGMAASAATLISCAADKRYIRENAYMLIHQISGGYWGTFEGFLDESQNITSMMKRIIDFYEKNTKIPKKQLANMLKHDLYWDAKTCLKHGLVDEILTVSNTRGKRK